ncbi:MAG: glycosyltransferase [Pleurocapsa minor GSE-CHR-MK-17-07R]|jgi:UDP:flavonoid glycosyltransferase YjiC (YdhE family)|nr:glycosyltransferase [Pleurocapsa minor GSE-CHR-MK 17-07R]
MRISIFVYGSWGDIRPHVVLGMALQAGGHDVQVVASRVYEAWVRARGLGFHALTTDTNTFARENASMMDVGLLRQLQLVRTLVTPILTQMGMEALEATRDSDVLMTVEFGVPLLFDVLRANRLRTILINPAPLNPTREAPFAAMPAAPGWFPFPQWYHGLSYSMIHRMEWMTLAGARHAIGKQLGVPKSRFRAFSDMLAATPALTTVSRHLFQRPADWPPHWQVTGYLFDDDSDWKPPQELTDFLDAGDPPVYIGFGSMPDSRPEATTRLLVDAVRAAGKRAVLLTGWAGLGIGPVPEDIHVLKYAPHSWLFPRMAAVVHHGGSGTTASGFRAGVPTVVVPHNADQPYWGRRAHELGVGTKPIPRKKLTAPALAAAIREATESRDMRAKASALGNQISAEDGLGMAVEFVESLLKQPEPVTR